MAYLSRLVHQYKNWESRLLRFLARLFPKDGFTYVIDRRARRPTFDLSDSDLMRQYLVYLRRHLVFLTKISQGRNRYHEYQEAHARRPGPKEPVSKEPENPEIIEEDHGHCLTRECYQWMREDAQRLLDGYIGQENWDQIDPSPAPKEARREAEPEEDSDEEQIEEMIQETTVTKVSTSSGKKKNRKRQIKK